MTQNEEKLVDNVIAKLKLYMDRNNKNLFSLSNTVKFDYQPFYRLMKKTHLPTLSSLFLIANNLNCTIQELISDNVFIDIPVYKSYKCIGTNDLEFNCRLFLSYDCFKQHAKSSFFGINTTDNNSLSIFLETNVFDTDGLFLVLHNDKLIMLEVSSISSSFVVAKLDGKNEIKVTLDQLKPLAKLLYDNVDLIKQSIYGVKNE